MNHSEQINEIAKALAAVQAELKPVKRDASNPFYKSKYADLEAISEACRELLSRHGVSVTQIPVMDNNANMAIMTMLLHTSGQWLRGVYPIKPTEEMRTLKKKDTEGKVYEEYIMVTTPQATGSAITYARRYSLAAMVGVVTTGEDDDGNTASNRTANSKDVSEYDKAKAGWVIPFEGDWSLWVSGIEMILDHAASMDDVSMLKKANAKNFKLLEVENNALFEEIKKQVGDKANAFM